MAASTIGRAGAVRARLDDPAGLLAASDVVLPPADTGRHRPHAAGDAAVVPASPPGRRRTRDRHLVPGIWCRSRPVLSPMPGQRPPTRPRTADGNRCACPVPRRFRPWAVPRLTAVYASVLDRGASGELSRTVNRPDAPGVPKSVTGFTTPIRRLPRRSACHVHRRRAGVGAVLGRGLAELRTLIVRTVPARLRPGGRRSGHTGDFPLM